MLHEMIWRVRDEHALQRELELQSARAGRPSTEAKIWFAILFAKCSRILSSGRRPHVHPRIMHVALAPFALIIAFFQIRRRLRFLESGERMHPPIHASRLTKGWSQPLPGLRSHSR